MNLALDFRPKKIDEIIGQRHLVDKNAPFAKLLKLGKLPHCMFFGPAGVGKTTLAKISANTLGLPFYEMDATSLKVEELRKIFESHKGSLMKPLVFIDEVHRLSKTQQEVLLIPMENQQAVIIGASTENPYFTLSSGIRSRSMLFEFFPLENKDLEQRLNTLEEKLNFSISKEAKEYLIGSSSGDCRAMLNLLELALYLEKDIKLSTLKNLRATSLKDGVSSDDTHYNLASSLIKSLRGSDVDAAIYYLARLIDGGESADFIARRLVIFASEDVGNANPNALILANSCLQSVSKIGFPEARIILSQCVVYLASCPKSNSSYIAINQALDYVKNNPKMKILKHLKSPNHEGYLYPHDFGGWVKQKYTEKEVKFYSSKGMGYEKNLLQWLEKIKSNS